jgi:TRAP-type mannitol/chloroaromatic compound transport system permease small subunit
MQILTKTGAAIDRINDLVGRASVWLLLAAVLLSAGNAIVRKLFAMSSNAMLEAQWYLVGTMVMLAAPWVLQQNAHVRIEILSARMSQTGRNVIELIGHLLMLLPFAAGMFWLSIPYFERSFRQGEQSLNAGGLVVWPMRGIVVLGFGLLSLQAVSAAFRVLREGAPSIEDPRTVEASDTDRSTSRNGSE